MSDLMISNSGLIAKAELDVQISTAKAYPRDTKRFMADAIALATASQDVAASCHYHLARKDRNSGEEKAIQGPSVRLAEIVAYSWGNLHAATRIVANDGKMITAEAVAWDLEKNVKVSTEVKRSIVTSTGKTYGNDMQVVTGNAASAIAFRNAIFKVLPRALVDQVYKAALECAVGDVKNFSTTRKNWIDRLVELGVSEQTMLDYFKKSSIEDINQNELRILIGVATSINEGYMTAETALKQEQEQKSKADEINDYAKTKGGEQ